jgi:hypothetical protein
MVIRAVLAAALMLAPNLRSDVGAELARPISPTVAVDAGPGFQKNHPVEDFFTVTIVSLPFTALWVLIGASVVGGISQGKYPPEFNSDMLIGAGAVALGASVGIGIVSVAWGKGRGKASSTPLQQGN